MGATPTPWRPCIKRFTKCLRREGPYSHGTGRAERAGGRRTDLLKEIKSQAAGNPLLQNADQADKASEEKMFDIDGGKLIASLTKVYANVMDSATSSPNTSCFHGRRQPTISIEDYLVRMRNYFKCSDACFLLALVYIIRMVDLCPNFVVNVFSIHRLLATSLLVSVKFHDDIVFSNTFYAKVCGIPHEELNTAELEFLKMINWNLRFSKEDFTKMYSEVVIAAEKAG
ncbi:CYCU4-1 [Symbiodinium pilosum]|uniref:CYCU4-1 protein n=1 Tax=Symbiodinium pilosum TaxID=2952 RepID=A0A812NA64_SYMPI|nr:CYCU4-1 [Symbiodinium pilosum]